MARQTDRHAGSGHLERAIFEPAERAALVRRALEALVRGLPAAGAALIRPCPEAPWQAEYAGARDDAMRRWLPARLGPSLEIVASNLKTGAPCAPDAISRNVPIGSDGTHRGGLLVLWPVDDASLDVRGVEIEGFRRALESLLEVERAEAAFFRSASDPLGPELSRALRSGDDEGLPALLTMARVVAGADLTYWGAVRDEALEVGWHVGAQSTGFGFELPLGKGVGGSAFARSEILDVPDYLNCQYRYPGVSDVTDSEGVRSTLAIPVRGPTPESGAVLYAVRREISPFTQTQRALLLRLRDSFEPALNPDPDPRGVFFRRKDGRPTDRSELRRILLGSKEVREVEAWLGRMVRGPVVAVDADGHPYALTNAEKLERLQLTAEERPSRPVPLAGSGGTGERGRLLVWPSVELPLTGWPDLLEDAATACSVVIDRMEQAHDRFNRQRSQWIRALAQGPPGQRLRREGDRLGMPTDRGEVWAVAWSAGTSAVSAPRPRMLAEELVLDQLGAPLTVLEDLGVILLRERAREEPSSIRDGLLRYFGPAPLWLVHGAGYDSFEGLGDALDQTITAARNARRDLDERYVVEVHSRGLDSLLENAGLSDELLAFADNTLKPLTDHDERAGSQLTETLCCTLALGSTAEAARRLFVHANTVRYRVRRAEQVLGHDLASPKDRVAMTLAAFIWLRHHEQETSEKPEG